MQQTIFQRPGNDAAALTFIHNEVENEILDEELSAKTQSLAIKSLYESMPGTICGGTRSWYRPLAKITHVAAKRTLIDSSVLGSRKRHTGMLKFHDGRNRLAA